MGDLESFADFWGAWRKRGGCAFHFMEIFHFVEMQSVFCLYLQNGLEIFNQILQPWSKFQWKHFESLYWKFQTSAHAHIAIAYLQIAYLQYAHYLQISSYDINFKLSLVYILINEVDQWFYQLDHVTFLKIYSNL